MASRLSRWALVAVAGAGVVAAILLTPGDSNLIYSAASLLREPTDAMDRLDHRNTALERAVAVTRNELDRARKQEAMARLTVAGQDPTALVGDSAGIVVDAVKGRALDSLWRTLPARSPAVRTVFLFQRYVAYRASSSARPSDGICYLALYASKQIPFLDAVRTRGGECVFSEEFGRPGHGWGQWFDALPATGVEWNRSAERWATPTPPFDPRHTWFTTGSAGGSLDDGAWGWGINERAYAACLSGRGDQCRVAFGVDHRWSLVTGRWSFLTSRGWVPLPAFPRALLKDLGPERFGMLWRSDEPIGTAYSKITGRPIDGWLVEWAQRRNGRLVRDQGLSPLGWVGLCIWLALIGGWNLLRLKYRTVA